MHKGYLTKESIPFYQEDVALGMWWLVTGLLGEPVEAVQLH